MTRLCLIANPRAARARSRILNQVVSVLESSGFDVTLTHTQQPGDAAQIARDAVSGGTEAVAIYGGDGTMIQAVDGMAERPVPLGIIPGGTGNLLAGNLRIPRNPIRAARVLARRNVRTIDLGRIDNADGSRAFAVACGAGYDADIMAGTRSEAKRRWGMGAYVFRVVSTLNKIVPVPFRLTIDGVVHDLEAVSIIVANCREIIPPVLSLARSVSLDDGTLDVFALRAHSLFGAARVVWHLVTQRVPSQWVHHYRGREIKVETADPHAMQLDGEAEGYTPFTATIQPMGLRVYTP